MLYLCFIYALSMLYLYLKYGVSSLEKLNQITVALQQTFLRTLRKTINELKKFKHNFVKNQVFLLGFGTYFFTILAE
jgi:hypothetical protein